MIGGNLDFSSNSARLNSLKRTLNSNGKSTTGLGHSGQDSSHMDQYLMHTATGKIYIPSDTPKNSTSDYKTSPGSSPSKKTSGSLLYKDGVSTLRGGGDHNHRHLHTASLHHHHHHRTKSELEETSLLYKFQGICGWKVATGVAALVALTAIIFAILMATGAVSWREDGALASAKCDGDREERQSDNGTHREPARTSKPSHLGGGKPSKLTHSHMNHSL